MRRLRQKARGLIGVGLTWGVLWWAIGVSVGLVIGIVDPDSIDPGESPFVVGWIIGLAGFLSGLCFAGLLSLAEYRKTILDPSFGRVALWGALAAVAPFLLTGMPDGMAVITGPLGAVFAVASLAIARRGERNAPAS